MQAKDLALVLRSRSNVSSIPETGVSVTQNAMLSDGVIKNNLATGTQAKMQ